MSIVYLASPYSNDSFSVRVARFNATTVIAARLIERGLVIFSPITMTHPIDLEMSGESSTMGSSYWTDFDQHFITACEQLRVIQLPGWDKSAGVTREISAFAKRGIEPQFIVPSDYGITATNPRFSAAF